MGLNLEKLMKFDLVDDIESRIHNDKKFDILMEFLDICQQIQKVDQFIRDCPSYPGSMDKIQRNELVSSVGATLSIEGTKVTNEEIEIALKKTDLNTELEKKDKETQNTKSAYDYITDLVNTGPNNKGKFIYKEEHIKQIHKHLTDNIDYGLIMEDGLRSISSTPELIKNQ